MKFVFALLALVFQCACSFAQVGFILSGQTADMIFTDYDPDLSFPTTSVGSSHSVSGSELLDVNRDGINDFQFTVNSSSSLGGSSSTYSLTALDQNLILTTMSIYIKHYQGSYPFNDTSMYVVAKRMLFGDTIFNTNDTIWKGGKVTLSTSFYIAGTSASLRDTSVASGNDVYFSLKVIVGIDTLLGYLHVSTQNLLMDFACQGSTSVYVISSVSDILNQETLLHPNPFTNQLNLSGGNPYDYKIIDLLGRVVATGTASNFISTTDLPPGSYLLLLKSEEISFSKRIMKVAN